MNQFVKQNVSIQEYLASKGIHVEYRKLFRCINPEHDDNHPSCIIYNNPWGDYIKCFSCDLYGDIFNLVGLLENIPEFSNQLKFLISFYGYKIQTTRK